MALSTTILVNMVLAITQLSNSGNSFVAYYYVPWNNIWILHPPKHIKGGTSSSCKQSSSQFENKRGTDYARSKMFILYMNMLNYRVGRVYHVYNETLHLREDNGRTHSPETKKKYNRGSPGTTIRKTLPSCLEFPPVSFCYFSLWPLRYFSYGSEQSQPVISL